jgi:hypothetical protein
MDIEADQTTLEADQAASGSDQPDRGVPPWTIKGVPPEVRYAAVKAAKDAEQTQAEWLSRAIRTLIQHDRQQNRLPVPVGQPVRLADPEADLLEIERLMGVVKDLHGVTAAPPPKRLTSLAYGLVSARLKTIKTNGQTEMVVRSDPIALQADRDRVAV